MNTGKTTMTTSATNASNILGVGNGATGGGGSQLETQLLECLEKLNLVIANQNRLELILAANGLITNVQASGKTVHAAIDF